MSEERMTETLNSAHKPIRSFIRRQGRITLAQEKALEMLWPRYGLEPGQAMVTRWRKWPRQVPDCFMSGSKFTNPE